MKSKFMLSHSRIPSWKKKEEKLADLELLFFLIYLFLSVFFF